MTGCSLTSPPPPGSATRRRMAVTAVTSCAVDAATTPTQTVWSSGATASTTGAAMSPAAGVSARWSATSASEAAPLLGDPQRLARGPGDAPWILACEFQMLDVEGGLSFASTWKPPGTEGRATRERGPGHQRKPTRLKITWQPEALECPPAAFQAGLRSQGHGFGKTGTDSTFPSQRLQPPGKWEVSLSSPECSAGLALETPGPPQGLSLLGPPHGTTSLGCKCFFVLFCFSSSGMWELQKYL